MRLKHVKQYTLGELRPEVMLSFSTWLLSTENTLVTAWCRTELWEEGFRGAPSLVPLQVGNQNTLALDTVPVIAHST